MSKQNTPSRSTIGAQERSGTGVMDQEPTEAAPTPTEVEAIKKEQKRRLDDIDNETAIDLYRQMLLIRRFEEKAAEAYSSGKIGGFCHLYIGQEAVAVGAISAIRKDDYVLASYREHGHALAKGMSAESIMAELFGTETG